MIFGRWGNLFAEMFIWIGVWGIFDLLISKLRLTTDQRFMFYVSVILISFGVIFYINKGFVIKESIYK